MQNVVLPYYLIMYALYYKLKPANSLEEPITSLSQPLSSHLSIFKVVSSIRHDTNCTYQRKVLCFSLFIVPKHLLRRLHSSAPFVVETQVVSKPALYLCSLIDLYCSVPVVPTITQRRTYNSTIYDPLSSYPSLSISGNPTALSSLSIA